MQVHRAAYRTIKYLQGLCCDIDVETGPGQLPSRYLRLKNLLQTLYVPPTWHALFTEAEERKTAA